MSSCARRPTEPRIPAVFRTADSLFPRDPRPIRKARGKAGLTLIELLIVMAVVGILAALGARPFELFRSRSAVRADLERLRADLEWARNRARRIGGVRIDASGAEPAPRLQKVFVVFDEAENGYRVFHWEDRDGDNRYDEDESVQVLPAGGGIRRLESSRFGWTRAVAEADRNACRSSGHLPSSAVTFGRPGYPPCNGAACVRFDAHGFSELFGSTVYLSDAIRSGDRYDEPGLSSYALWLGRAGTLRTCRWDETRKRWKVVR